MGAEKEKILYLECYSGISGDMTVGALLDLGANREKLEETLAGLGVGGYHLHFGRTKKCGIDAYDFDVHLEQEEDGPGHSHDDGEGHPHCHEHNHGEDHFHGHCHEHDHGEDHFHGHCHVHGHEEEHFHDHCHEHNHEEEHFHGHCHEYNHGEGHSHPHVHRNIHDINEIIGRLEDAKVRRMAEEMFALVAKAESKAHGIPVEQVHFHEVGAVDSIVDIISTAFCIRDLGIRRVAVSPLFEGRGYVRCQHGIMPVPVPATAGIAAACGLKLHLTDNEGEMVTPTGAAIAGALRTEKELPEHYAIERIGVGAGKKDFKNANILRAMILVPEEESGETKGRGTDAGAAGRRDADSRKQGGRELDGRNPGGGENGAADADGGKPDGMWVLETNMDDCPGEALGFLMELLMEEGAADAWYTPAYMKKCRPAYTLHVLCAKEKMPELEALVFAHTTTIGIRRYPVERTVLKRREMEIELFGETVQVKACGGRDRERYYPEYESIRALCRKTEMGFSELYHVAKARAKAQADQARTQKSGAEPDGGAVKTNNKNEQ